MLRDLGAAFYAPRTGRSTPSTTPTIEGLADRPPATETENGPITLAPEVGGADPDRRPETNSRG